MSTVAELCPVYAPFFGAMGCTSAIVFTCIGAAYVHRHSLRDTAHA